MVKNCKGRVSLLYKKLRDVLCLESCIAPGQVHLGKVVLLFSTRSASSQPLCRAILKGSLLEVAFEFSLVKVVQCGKGSGRKTLQVFFSEESACVCCCALSRL